MEFKIGDRIEGIGEVDRVVIDGKIGTIARLSGASEYAEINFDDDFGGWGDERLGIEYGHAWNVPVSQLRLKAE